MKEITFDTKMTKDVVFKYLLRHTYTSSMGIVGLAAGLALLAAFVFRPDYILYLIGGVVVILYLPISLYFIALRQTKLNPAFQKPLTYTISEAGLKVAQDGQERAVEWTGVVRAVYTKSMIIVYTSRVNAWIFPRADLGDKHREVEDLIKSCLGKAGRS